jgi:hypothetical protein
MYSGLILLVFIGLCVAWLFTRIRRKMGMPVNGKTWLTIVIVFAVVMSIAYGTTQFKH